MKLTEKRFQANVLELAGFCGWQAYHTYDSRRCVPGFPDLVLVRDRVLFRELKTDVGRLSVAQRGWLDVLGIAGADVSVWRPSMWDVIVAELK